MYWDKRLDVWMVMVNGYGKDRRSSLYTANNFHTIIQPLKQLES